MSLPSTATEGIVTGLIMLLVLGLLLHDAIKLIREVEK